MKSRSIPFIFVLLAIAVPGAHSFAAIDDHSIHGENPTDRGDICSSDNVDKLMDLIKNKEWDQSELIAKEQYNHCTDKGLFAYLLAEIAENKGDAKKGYEYLSEVVNEVDSGQCKSITKENVYYETGRIAFKVGKYGEALSFLLKVEAMNPYHDNLQYLIGHAYADLGKPKQANEYFQRCLKNDNNKSYERWCYQYLHPAIISNDKNKFSDALAKAKSQENGSVFSEYRDKKLYPDFGAELGNQLRFCLENIKHASKDPFDMVINLNAAGNVEKIFLKPRTNTGDCVAEKIRHSVFAAPPVSEFYEEINVKIHN